jgi:hypothetical protein
MFARRRGAPWLPALIAGGIGAAVISKRARWHAAQQGFGPGPGGPGFGRPGFGGHGFGGGLQGRGLPPMIEEMLNAWHRKAHGETAPSKPSEGPTDPSGKVQG